MAPSHDFGRASSSLRHTHAAPSQKKTPELTLDRTVRLICSAFKLPTLTPEMAIRLVEYHIKRNQIATKSHTKTWMQKYRRKKYLLL